MFYNLFISGDSDAWEGNSFIIDANRCIKEKEYTLKKIVDKYGRFGEKEIEELKTFPCIFAYEKRINKDPAFGYITDIIVRQNKIKVYFEKYKINKGFSQEDINNSMFELDIEDWEFSRTHWAIKDADFEKLFNRYGIETEEYKVDSGKPVNIISHYFDVSFTFAGESRDYVEKTVKELEKLINTNKIFYDNNYKSQLARPSIDDLLQDIYRNRSKLVVVFLCEKYQEKEWCGVEFRAIKEMIKQKEHDNVMFIRLDNGHVDGIFSTDGYIDGRTHSPKEVAGFINERIYLLGDISNESSIINKVMIQDMEDDLLKLRKLLKTDESLFYDICNEDFICPFKIDVFTKFDISVQTCIEMNFYDNNLQSFTNDYIRNINELVRYISEYTRPTANPQMAVLKRIGPRCEVEGGYSDFDVVTDKMMELRKAVVENFQILKEYEKTLKENIILNIPH